MLAVQGAPKVLLSFGWDHCDLPQQRPCNFKEFGSFEFSSLSGSLTREAHKMFSARFRCKVMELWNTNIIWKVIILTDTYLNLFGKLYLFSLFVY